MSGWSKRFGGLLLAGATAMIAAACSSGSPEDAAAQGEAFTVDCVTETIGTTRWLFDPACGCPYPPGSTLYVQCTYQARIADCIHQAGYPTTCGNLPPLSVVLTKSQSQWADFPIERLGGSCVQMTALYQCIEALNQSSSPAGVPYWGPPVDAHFIGWCDARPPVCGLPMQDDIFDPCAGKQCSWSGSRT
jgi:hypothetical protein